jgi:NTP pyrophosphatase (non-canonical NTP hydrolase)
MSENNPSGFIDEDILQKAINTWGTVVQIEMLKEECIELALALQKLSRARGDEEEKERNIIDEIADVKIMICQAQRIFPADKINERVDYKMKRLEQRLIQKLA